MKIIYKLILCIVVCVPGTSLYGNDIVPLVSLSQSLQLCIDFYKAENGTFLHTHKNEKLAEISLVIPEKYKSVVSDAAYGIRQGAGAQQNNRIVYSDFLKNDGRLIFALFDGFNGSYVADLLAKQGPALLNNAQLYGDSSDTAKKQRVVFHALHTALAKDSQATLQGAFIACAVLQGSHVWLGDLSLYPCVIHANGDVNSRKIQEDLEAKYIEGVKTQDYKETDNKKGLRIPYKDQNTVKYIDMYKKVFGVTGDFFVRHIDAKDFPNDSVSLRPMSPLSSPLLNWQKYDLSSDASNPIAIIVLSNNAVQKVLSNEEIAFTVKSGVAVGKNAQALAGDILDKAQKMTQESVACIVLCTQNVLKDKGFSSETYPTFTSWYSACKKLPLNRVKTSSGRGGHTKKDYKDTAIDVADFEKQLANFCMLSSDALHDSKKWFSGQQPPLKFYSDLVFPYGFFLNKNSDIASGRGEVIQPFVEHLVVSNSARIAFHGDFHGDIHSMIEYLNYLKSIKFIDDSFKIVESQDYMAFLGDYTDRGMYGMEVVYTIMRLKLANPDRVILVRGNHEDIMQTQEDGFVTEIQFKTQKFFKDDPDMWRKLCNKIHKIYDFMPVAVYVGTATDVLQCCHGGMEIGYNPQLFLQSATRYALVSNLKRKTNIDAMKVIDLFEVNAAFNNSFNKDIEKIETYSDIGFMWSDFRIDGEKNAFYRENRGLQYSKNITYKMLEFYNQQTVKIRGVFRAHQHDGNFMMKSILYGGGKIYKGISLLWEKDSYITEQQINTPLPLWQGIVATFNVGPDSWMGTLMDFSYDTFGILKIAQEFKDWRLQVVNQEIMPK